MSEDAQSIAARSIEALRQRYANELAEQERRLSALRAKVQVLDEVLADQRNGQKMLPTVNGADALPQGYSAAIQHVVSHHGRTNGVTTTDIRGRLLSSGFKPSGKNFMGTVRTTLKRLVRNERITAEKINGIWVYRAKP